MPHESIAQDSVEELEEKVTRILSVLPKLDQIALMEEIQENSETLGFHSALIRFVKKYGKLVKPCNRHR